MLSYLIFSLVQGTTLHALALINAQLGGFRRAILVSNNEPGEKKAKQLERSGLFLGDPAYENEGICESVTWPRCKHVINGKRDDGTTLTGKYLGLSSEGNEMKLSDGLQRIKVYFRLEFLDPAQVARGDAFQAIVPILWLVSGCQGGREDSKGSQLWFIPKHSPFAVLIKEKEFLSFREKLAQRKDVKWVFLITDSEENFGIMRRVIRKKLRMRAALQELPRKLQTEHARGIGLAN